MIYQFLYPLHTMFSFFNVFRYITFRTIFASITALLICLILGRWFIQKLQSLQIDQQIREDGPKDASGEERHAHDGRRAHYLRSGHFHIVVGQSWPLIMSGWFCW